MDQKSLPGMSMSARKRAARLDAITANPDGKFRSVIPSTRRGCLEVWACNQPAVAARYAEARIAYRIGERLRPCWRCLGRAAFREDVAGLMPCDECAGSGVIPAKRAVPRVP